MFGRGSLNQRAPTKLLEPFVEDISFIFYPLHIEGPLIAEVFPLIILQSHPTGIIEKSVVRIVFFRIGNHLIVDLQLHS